MSDYSVFQSNSVNRGNIDLYDQFGYQYFGPLLHGFIQWIMSEAEIADIDKVFFLSRDGHLMNRAYSLAGGENAVYMYASRRALHVPVIHFFPSYQAVLDTMFLPGNVTTSWLIGRWGLEVRECAEELQKVGLRQDDAFHGKCLPDNKKTAELFSLLQERIIANSKTEYEAFKQYLHRIAFHGHVMIVDIGWNGNMQNCLETIIKAAGINADITGRYMGVIPNSHYQKRYSMKGYLFSEGNHEDFYWRFKYLCTIMELLFMAPHGSARRYVFQGKYAELEPFEYEGTETKLMVDAIQDGALRYVRDKYENSSSGSDKDSLIYVEPIFNVLTRPCMKFANTFGEIALWNERWLKLAPRRSLQWCVCHPHRFAEELLMTPWKEGYLKRILRLPLPYEEILLKMRKIHLG